jgi:hypothetical protein
LTFTSNIAKQENQLILAAMREDEAFDAALLETRKQEI